MAARVIGMDELGAAVKEYASRHELTMSSNDKGIHFHCLEDIEITSRIYNDFRGTLW